MEGYSMYFPCYTIGHGVYEKVGKVCCDYGTSAVIIGGIKHWRPRRTSFCRHAGKGGSLLPASCGTAENARMRMSTGWPRSRLCRRQSFFSQSEAAKSQIR